MLPACVNMSNVGVLVVENSRRHPTRVGDCQDVAEGKSNHYKIIRFLLDSKRARNSEPWVGQVVIRDARLHRTVRNVKSSVCIQESTRSFLQT